MPTRSHVDIARLYKTNDRPTETERQEIQGRLAEACAKKLVRVYKRILSPMRRVPGDVLLLIFEHCSDMYHGLYEGQDEKAREYPWFLTWVCIAWRYIVIGTPTLWKKQQFIFEGSLTGACKKLRQELALSRSASHPLDLSVMCRTFADDPAISEVLISAMHRVVELELDRIPAGLARKFLQMPAGSCPLLKALVIAVPSNADEEEFNETTMSEPIFNGWMATVFNNSPHLREVLLCCTDTIYHFRPLTIGVPWAQITVIEMNGIGTPAVNVYELLLHCRFLEELHIYLDHDSDNFTSHSPIPFICESIQKLFFAASSHHAVGALLDHIDLPQLTDLKGGWGGCDSPDVEDQYTAISACMLRSFFNLTTFVIHPTEQESHPHSGDKLLEFLWNVPTLTTLRCIDSKLPPTFFSELTASPSQDAAADRLLLPLLQSLEIRCSEKDFRTFSRNGSIVDMVVSRHMSTTNDIAVLERFHLEVTVSTRHRHFIDPQLLDLSQKISQYCDDGFDLLITPKYVTNIPVPVHLRRPIEL